MNCLLFVFMIALKIYILGVVIFFIILYYQVKKGKQKNKFKKLFSPFSEELLGISDVIYCLILSSIWVYSIFRMTFIYFTSKL